jgi:hypothetical protein
MSTPATINKLTKADTVALWHAVDDMGYMTRAMRTEPAVTPEQVAQRQAVLKAAQRALRKVNAIRKAQQ